MCQLHKLINISANVPMDWGSLSCSNDIDSLTCCNTVEGEVFPSLIMWSGKSYMN